MRYVTKKAISIVLLIATILGELAGLTIAFLTEEKPYLFFTNIGNAFYLIVAILVLIAQISALRKKKQISRWGFVLHYTGTVTEVLIFLIVCLYLVWFNGPMMLYSGSFPFLHVLCPILAIVNHYVFLGKSEYSFKDGGWGFLPPVLYACIIIPLCALKIIEAPYPFLDFSKNQWWMTLLYAVGALVILWLICYALIRYAKKTQNITEKDQ